MPDAGKTICANSKSKAQFETVKLCKGITAKAAK
jgi:hypothetical protein